MMSFSSACCDGEKLLFKLLSFNCVERTIGAKEQQSLYSRRASDRFNKSGIIAGVGEEVA